VLCQCGYIDKSDARGVNPRLLKYSKLKREIIPKIASQMWRVRLTCFRYKGLLYLAHQVYESWYRRIKLTYLLMSNIFIQTWVLPVTRVMDLPSTYLTLYLARFKINIIDVHTLVATYMSNASWKCTHNT
jgi:hypothetical protein